MPTVYGLFPTPAVIVAIVLAVLFTVAVVALGSGAPDAARLDEIGSDASFGGVLQSAGPLFSAFVGYARIAALGEGARDPARTVPVAPGIAFAVSAAYGVRRAVAVRH
ncbi:hypothetical protein ACFV0C_03330 [Streptomyces sp. NPDC059568]|uniref:hypothetical protein n=1 Tax=Streptomyces sp. NPDC059568 TaxID=3346868 RepID=UPI0036871FD6